MLWVNGSGSTMIEMIQTREGDIWFRFYIQNYYAYVFFTSLLAAYKQVIIIISKKFKYTVLKDGERDSQSQDCMFYWLNKINKNFPKKKKKKILCKINVPSTQKIFCTKNILNYLKTGIYTSCRGGDGFQLCFMHVVFRKVKYFKSQRSLHRAGRCDCEHENTHKKATYDL